MGKFKKLEFSFFPFLIIFFAATKFCQFPLQILYFLFLISPFCCYCWPSLSLSHQHHYSALPAGLPAVTVPGLKVWTVHSHQTRGLVQNAGFQGPGGIFSEWNQAHCAVLASFFSLTSGPWDRSADLPQHTLSSWKPPRFQHAVRATVALMDGSESLQGAC